MERTHGNTTKEERKAAKRAKLLDELIAAAASARVREPDEPRRAVEAPAQARLQDV
jgi:hypothetical protein